MYLRWGKAWGVGETVASNPSVAGGGGGGMQEEASGRNDVWEMGKGWRRGFYLKCQALGGS